MDKQREAFEAWHGGIYRGFDEEIAWAAWKSATAAERERAAKVCEVQLDEPASTNWNIAVKCCAAVIRAG